MINTEIIESFWERTSISEANDKFTITLFEAKQLISMCKSDIYNNVDLEFEPVKNKAERLYNEFTDLINDAWSKSKSKTPYTYKSFFNKYIKLNNALMYLYIESDTKEELIEEISTSISILTETFIK